MDNKHAAVIGRLKSHAKVCGFMIDKYEKDDTEPERFRLGSYKKDKEQTGAAIAALEQAERWAGLIEIVRKSDTQLCYGYLKEIGDGSEANAQLLQIVDALFALVSALPEPPEGGRVG